MNLDRFSGLLLLALGLLVISAAWQFYVPYQYEPLGPKAMPIVVGMLLLLCGIQLLFVAAKEPAQSFAWSGVTNSRPLMLCALLFGYGLCYEPLGFLISSLCLCTGLARLCGASVGWSLVVGVGLALAGQLVLVVVLGLQLPLGLARHLGLGWL